MLFERLRALSFRTKLLAALVVVNIPIFVVLSTSEIIAVRNFSFKRETDVLTTEGQFLAHRVSSALFLNDSARVSRILSAAITPHQIKSASILDSEDMVIMSTDPSLLGKYRPLLESLPRPNGEYILKSFIVSGKPIHRSMPRFLQIEFSLSKAFRDVASTVYWEVFIDLVELLIILLVAWILSGILQKPLNEMRDVSDKMATGDFSSRVAVRSGDVIGRLAGAFNNMASRLDTLTNDLQNEIDRATGELTARNTELKEKHRELEETNRKLRELDILKSDFVSMVSHELRTPLTSIIGFAKTLKTLPLSGEQQKHYLDIIESEGKRLSSLVEEYLDISKIESGNISLQRAPIKISSLIKSAVESFSLAQRKIIIVDVPADVPDIMADGNLIIRVLYNLIDNAIKYSGSQEIIVTAHVKDNGIAVSVRDFGPGIAPDDIDKVFGKFYRGKNQAAAKHRGSGLGLAISKGIIEAHNGKIWCESEPGKGTKFTFFLPFAG
ncbi:MAG TPA: ATP-binding protein [Chitinivibrionales bacterium]|nr:ATP-binding protein [Chitinivibrionales bacterium]